MGSAQAGPWGNGPSGFTDSFWMGFWSSDQRAGLAPAGTCPGMVAEGPGQPAPQGDAPYSRQVCALGADQGMVSTNWEARAPGQTWPEDCGPPILACL